MAVNVGTTICVGVERMKMTVEVAVGEGVKVGCVGVGEGVNVSVGRAAAVCVNAAFAVDTMMVLISFGSVVGYGVIAIAGAQARINAIVVNRYRSFALRVDIWPLSHPKRIGMQMFRYFSTRIAVYG
jgi:hypothetical protein